MDGRDVGISEPSGQGLGVERLGGAQLLEVHARFTRGGEREPDVLQCVLEREFRRPIAVFDLRALEAQESRGDVGGKDRFVHGLLREAELSGQAQGFRPGGLRLGQEQVVDQLERGASSLGAVSSLAALSPR